MPLSKLTLLAAGLAMVFSTAGLSTAANAQSAQAQPQSGMMSEMGEGEMVYMHAGTGRVTKSKKNISDATHAKATQMGARALAQGTMVYRKGGTLYLLENKPGTTPGQTMIQENFQDHFDGNHVY